MADFLHFFNTNAGINISSVTSNNGGASVSKVFKTESLSGASGLNSSYSNRFPAKVIEADTLNNLSGDYYLTRNNHLGNVDNQNVYFSGLGYSDSSGVDYNNSYQSGTYVLDWKKSNLQTISLSGNTTLVFSGATEGSRLQLLVKQDSVGSRTISWPSSVKWQGGGSPTLTTTQSGVDIIAFYTNSSNYYGSSGSDFR